ncbi:alpha/beta fold hydrolase [Sungkyunkwania multivorans]|uniref:Alpha/beta fold hydrolase n=1 Tax=Sungkyunkwania multivorans TaxID=1173618 RepID=A0ABW3D416_9FLAO
MDITTWYRSGKYFLYKDKHRIFYQEKASDKPKLLLLHGFPTASWDWNKIWEDLAKKFHLIAPDFMGFGFSDKPKSYTYTVHDQADMVEALLRLKNIDSLHVLAHDFGDTVMQELLARSIESSSAIHYRSICLLNGGIIPESHQPRPIQKALIGPFGLLITPFLSKKKLKKNFHEIFGKETPPSDEEIDEFYTLISFNRGKYVFHKLIRYMTERKMFRDRWVGALQNCPIPISMINGNQDPVSGKHLADEVRKLMPVIKMVDLPTIGHYPQTEAPEKVLSHFFEFQTNHFSDQA